MLTLAISMGTAFPQSARSTVISRCEDGAEWSGARVEKRVVTSVRARIWVADIVDEGW